MIITKIQCHRYHNRFIHTMRMMIIIIIMSISFWFSVTATLPHSDTHTDSECYCVWKCKHELEVITIINLL